MFHFLRELPGGKQTDGTSQSCMLNHPTPPYPSTCAPPVHTCCCCFPNLPLNPIHPHKSYHSPSLSSPTSTSTPSAACLRKRRVDLNGFVDAEGCKEEGYLATSIATECHYAAIQRLLLRDQSLSLSLSLSHTHTLSLLSPNFDV